MSDGIESAPGQRGPRPGVRKARPFLMLAAACFILALAGWGIYYARAAQEMRQSTERLQPKIDKMRAAEAKFAQLRKETAALDSMATPLITAINDRNFWPEILE